MYYGTIKKTDIADGLGVRVSLFVSGCRNHCKGCQNMETWNFKYGKEFTAETEEEILKALEPDYIAGLTVLGGEPFEEENQEVLAPFLERVKEKFPKKDIWCYTGYVYATDLLPSDGKKHTEFTKRMLDCINILVDGPYIEELRDISLNFRGSSNQQILLLH
ncbi:MAG: anaerobic ribonucleoside-triphosphate reductase activating protein [Treponema sp.]|nr:anaerobic ribonucleoside-triphosphate reductase activating protein [Treponema sp.]